MTRIRKQTEHFKISHGMNYQKCAKIQHRKKECAKKRKSRNKMLQKDCREVEVLKSKKPKKQAKQKKD